MTNFKEILGRVNTFIFDIDGVLSKQTVAVNTEGVPSRTANLRDGYAIQLAIRKGYRLAIISGGHSEDYLKRLNSLGVTDIYMNSHTKINHFREYLEKYSLDAASVLYMGDDIPDIKVMQMAGIPVCPADADSEIRKLCVYISDKNGGEGCVRDVIEQVMRLHNKWLDNDAFKW